MSLRDWLPAFALLPCVALAQPEPPPVPPDMAESDRHYLMRRQQEIFRLNVETDYALALQKLCQTGFGDPKLCQSTQPKLVAPISAAASPGLIHEHIERNPIVQEISGFGQDLTALLLMPDGRQLSVHKLSQLPNGAVVNDIETRRVLLRSSGQTVISLPLAEARE